VINSRRHKWLRSRQKVAFKWPKIIVGQAYSPNMQLQICLLGIANLWEISRQRINHCHRELFNFISFSNIKKRCHVDKMPMKLRFHLNDGQNGLLVCVLSYKSTKLLKHIYIVYFFGGQVFSVIATEGSEKRGCYRKV